MRSSIALIVLGGLTSTFATSVPGLPDCAGTCVTDDFGGCQIFDVKCICSSTTLIANLACCVSKVCSADDQKKTIVFANSLCGGEGVKNLPQSATCAPGATFTASTTLSPASSSSSSTSTSSTGVSSPSTTATTGTTSSSANLAAAAQQSSTTMSTTGTSSGGAAIATGVGQVGLGMVVAGVFAML